MSNRTQCVRRDITKWAREDTERKAQAEREKLAGGVKPRPKAEQGLSDRGKTRAVPPTQGGPMEEGSSSHRVIVLDEE